MTGSRMEVVTLLADQGGETSNLAEKVLARLFAHQMPEVLHELVKVGSSGGYAGRFSAWDRGVAQFGKELERFDFVNLVTPEFRWLKAESLRRLDGDVLSLVRRRAVALGELGVHDDPVGHGQLDSPLARIIVSSDATGRTSATTDACERPVQWTIRCLEAARRSGMQSRAG